MKNIGFLLLLIIALPAIAGAAQPSFDCSKAAHPVEKMICNRDDLAQLDRELSVLYKKLQNKYGHNIIKFYQQDWLEVRNRCNDFECLLKSYEERVDEFRSLEAKRMDREGVWDVRLNNAFRVGQGVNSDYLLVTTDNEDNVITVNFFFSRVSFKIIYKSDRFNSIHKKDMVMLSPVGWDPPYKITFPDNSTLSQAKAIAPSAKCRGFYHNSKNFLLTDGTGNKQEKILLLLLEKPLSRKGNYCEDGDFDQMDQRVFKVFPTFYNLEDSTFLVLVDRGDEDYAIRFDSSLKSKSELFGTKFFWLGVDEYKKMIDKFKKTGANNGIYTRKQEDEIAYEWIMEQRGGI